MQHVGYWGYFAIFFEVSLWWFTVIAILCYFDLWGKGYGKVYVWEQIVDIEILFIRKLNNNLRSVNMFSIFINKSVSIFIQ